jgi:hypothetical protein
MIRNRTTKSAEYRSIGTIRDSAGRYRGHKDNHDARAIRRASDKRAVARAFAEYI